MRNYRQGKKQVFLLALRVCLGALVGIWGLGGIKNYAAGGILMMEQARFLLDIHSKEVYILYSNYQLHNSFIIFITLSSVMIVQGFRYLIGEHKKALLNQWVEITIGSYSSETARVLAKDSNRFDNPVGAVTKETLEAVIDLLCDGFDRDDMEKALDPLIRIRAVQSFTAADAVAFLFSLKPIVENLLKEKNLQEFHQAVDEIVLAGFNRYMKCREDIFLLKATESKRRVYNAFERAGLVQKMTEEDLLGVYKDDRKDP